MSRRLLSPMPQQIVAAQRDASDPERSVWVTANAGSGKTYVLTARVLRLLLSGAKPEEILCLTYTKAAAAEMRGRVAERLGQWALGSEDELIKDLTALSGLPPPPARRLRAPALFARLGGQPMGRVRRMYADAKYHNFKLYEWVEANAAWGLCIVRRPEGQRGWVRLPIRWTVERTFAWLGRCRRLSKDREKSTLSSETFIKLAMIHLMLNRLQPKNIDAAFHYRPAA